MHHRVTAVLVSAALALAGALAAPHALAAKPKTLVFDVDLVSAGTTLETLPGGVTYGWNDLRGPTRWGKRAAAMRFLGSVDYVNGTGPFNGFVTVTRADGVKIALAVTGWSTTPPREQGTADARFRGSVTVIGGTGPFARATGSGSMEGSRKAALGSPVKLTFSLVVQRR